MDTEIRAARAADMSAIAALEAACFSLPRAEDAIQRALGDFLVAVKDGQLLGYGDFQTVLDEGYIGNIAVMPSARRQGVGAALLRAMLARGAAQELAFLTLEVRESNEAARALYTAHGFEIVGQRKKVYERPMEDAILMTYYYKEGQNLC